MGRISIEAWAKRAGELEWEIARTSDKKILKRLWPLLVQARRKAKIHIPKPKKILAEKTLAVVNVRRFVSDRIKQIWYS
jgi:hypothetical protein